MKAPREQDRFLSRSEAVAHLPLRLGRDGSSEEDPAATLDRGLAIARGARGLTFIAVPAPLLPAAALVDAMPGAPLVAWAGELTCVGLGVARALRGTGAERWSQIAAAARGLEIYGAVFATDDPAPPRRASLFASDVHRWTELGFARPRLFGGGAFAPGAAEAGPWIGFGDAWFVLPRWTYTATGREARLVLAIDERDARDAARWRGELAVFRALFAAPPRHAPANSPRTPATEIARASVELWRAQVEAITSAIDAGACSKIVAARTCTVGLPPVVEATASHEAASLASLDERHRDCVRLLVRPPEGGALIAATPERLVRRDGPIVRCDALAGTVRHGGDEDKAKEAAAQLLASAKDRREHELVVRAIDDALTALGAEIDAPAEPAIRALRHVLHLHTPIRARLPAPRHVLELVAALHPTPAVGGTPTAYAIDWIRDHEPVPRGWYASPVGWFDLDGDGDFAVAIRSGVIVGDRAHLWAGAGIVAGSDPERELAETELKLRAMLGALGVAR